MSGIKHRYLKGPAIEIYSLLVSTANALNSVFSFIKMSDRLEICLFILSDRHVPLCNRNSYTNVRKCKHPFSRNQHLQNVEH